MLAVLVRIDVGSCIGWLIHGDESELAHVLVCRQGNLLVCRQYGSKFCCWLNHGWFVRSLVDLSCACLILLLSCGY